MDSGHDSYPRRVSDLRTSTDPLVHLSRIKHQIIGYDDNKQTWVNAGLVPVLANLLRSEQPAVPLQATIILCSLARGPSSCAFEILNRVVLDQLSQTLVSTTQADLRLATLQVFETLAVICSSPHLCHRAPYSALFSVLSSGPVRTALTRAIADEQLNSVSARIAITAMKIIERSCLFGYIQDEFAHGTVLQALSARLGRHIAARLCSPGLLTRLRRPGSSVQAALSGKSRIMMKKAQHKKHMCGDLAISSVLATLAAIVRDSHERAQCLMSTPTMIVLDTYIEPPRDPQPQDPLSPVAGAAPDTGLTALLPPLLDCSAPNKRSNNQTGRSSVIGSDWPGLTPGADQHFQERPLILRLIALARREDGVVRLLVIQLLAALYRADSVRQYGTCRCREKRMEIFVIPMLMRQIAEAHEPSRSRLQLLSDADSQMIQEVGPSVLALLLVNSAGLASSAVSSPSAAISRMARLLHSSFQPPRSATLTVPWSPLPGTSSGSLELLTPPLLSKESIHKLRVRESALKALAALVHEESHRTELLQQNVMGLISDAMRPLLCLPALRSSTSSGSGSSKSSKEKPAVQISNPPGILIAACACVKALSRSVPISRKDLADAGIAKPILELMQHEDIDVQIMATQVAANLLIHYSSVRELLAKEGIVRIIDSQMHSPHPRLQLEALFALRNLVYDNSVDMRIQILDTIGIDYLMQLLASTEDYHIPRHSSDHLGQSRKNRSSQMVDSIGLLAQRSPDQQLQSESIGESEIPTPEDSHMAEVALQLREQTLIMIRHLITPPDASVLFEKLIDHLSVPRFFELLSINVRPIHRSPERNPLDPSVSFDGASDTLGGEYADACILEAVIFILVHIAAADSRHRTLLMAQSDFLRSLQPLLKHPSREVRHALLTVVCHLTHERADEDLQSVRSRARIFRQWGWLADIDRLEKGYPAEEVRDVDQREVAKRASQQIRGLVSG